MFPDKLDNAKVLYYTPKGDYGAMYYDTGEVAAYFEYLAICKYENDRGGYYLFYCNADKEVETDMLWNSVEECMSSAEVKYGGEIVWNKK